MMLSYKFIKLDVLQLAYLSNISWVDQGWIVVYMSPNTIQAPISHCLYAPKYNYYLYVPT